LTGRATLQQKCFGRKSSSSSGNTTACVDRLDSAGSGQSTATGSCAHDFIKKHTTLILSKRPSACERLFHGNRNQYNLKQQCLNAKTRRRLVEIYRRLKGTCCPHHQGILEMVVVCSSNSRISLHHYTASYRGTQQSPLTALKNITEHEAHCVT